MEVSESEMEKSDLDLRREDAQKLIEELERGQRILKIPLKQK